MKLISRKFGLLILIGITFFALTGCQLNREEPTSEPTSAETGSNDSATIEITVPAATVTPLGGVAPEGGEPTVVSVQPTATTASTDGATTETSPESGDTTVVVVEEESVTVVEGADSAGSDTSTGTSDSTSTDSGTSDSSDTWTSMPAGSGGETIHIVKPGENLFRISLQYGMTTDALARYNGIQNPDAIYAGQKLRIPTGGGSMPPGGGQGQVYTVKPGDTLTSIATKFMVPVNAIMMANNISNADQIYAGQKLVIP